MHDLRRILPLLVAFTLGALLVEVRSQRTQAALAVDVERSYLDGLRDGEAEAWVRAHERIEEDSPLCGDEDVK